MGTLTNVETRRGEANPPSVRVAPDTIPEARSSRTGVSVKYVPDHNKSWYVLRASYSREDKAKDYIVEDGTFVYIPKRYTRKSVNGRQKKVLETLIPNLLFVYTTEKKAETYIKNTPALSYLTYYYNHFDTIRGTRQNPPLKIECCEMENFIAATCSQNEHIMIVDKRELNFKSGDKVIVTDGDFAGVTGVVVRISGQKRVAVSISGLCTIVTAYIPSAFIDKL